MYLLNAAMCNANWTPDLKFVVTAVSEILKGPKILKIDYVRSRSRLTCFYIFFELYSLCASGTPDFKLIASAVSEMLTGSQNFKSILHDPGHAPFDLSLHFFVKQHV